MSNETEKLTINLGVVELAQVDVLVEQGIYSNRSDLIRTAIRKHLEDHSEKIERVIKPAAGAKPGIWCMGIISLSKKDLEDAFQSNGGQPIKISVIGMLKIGKDVSAELFQKTVARVNVHGKISAEPEIKKLAQNMH